MKKEELRAPTPKAATFESETAGSIMTAAVPTVAPETTCGEIQQLIRSYIHEYDTVNYIYALNKQSKLVGVVSIREVFSQTATVPVSRVMVKKIISVHPHTRQKRLVYDSLRHNIKAIPVVDKDNIFLGVVPSETLISVMNNEAHRTLFRFAGMSGGHAVPNTMEQSLFSALKHRLPWLAIGLAGGVFAASIISAFEQTLEQNLILAAFLPLIVYMSDAVGTQIEAIIIRDIAFQPDLRFKRYFLKQLSIILFVGVSMGGAIFAYSMYAYGTFSVALVLGIALFAAIVSSVLTGLLIPYSFSRMKYDPANASGPIATIIQDLLSITVYFMIASILLGA